VKQLFRYAWGRRETAADAPLIGRATQVFHESGFRIKSLIAFLARALATENMATENMATEKGS
jgi:hypothetical protein